MTDVQLGDGGDDCDSTDSIEGKAMPGMAFQAKLVSQGRSLANAREGGFRPLPLRILEVGVAECPGVQFHDRCTEPYGSLELRGIRFDEEGDPRSGGSQPADEALQEIGRASGRARVCQYV